MFARWRRKFDPTHPTQPPPGVTRTLARALWRKVKALIVPPSGFPR